MTTGIIDPLKAVQIEKAEYVFGPFLRSPGERSIQPPLKLGAIDQASQVIVSRPVP